MQEEMGRWHFAVSKAAHMGASGHTLAWLPRAVCIGRQYMWLPVNRRVAAARHRTNSHGLGYAACRRLGGTGCIAETSGIQQLLI